MRLTDKTVGGLVLPTGKTDVIHFDTDLTGFGFRLRLGASDRVLKSWIAQYRIAGRPRRLLIGSAAVLGAEQARGAAKRALAEVALGRDPQSERSDRRGADRMTMRMAVAEYLTAAATRVRPGSLYELRRYLQGAYFRALHGAPLDRVDRKGIAAILVTIERENGAPTAMKARAALSGLFVWALRSGLTDANPVAMTPKPAAGRGRERILSDIELGNIWRACGDDAYGRIVRLLILSAGRRAEIGGMAWGELDLDAGVWTLPSARSKNGRPHVLPIMPMMRAIIEQVPRRATRDQLFGERGAAFAGWHHGKIALDERSGVCGWTIHDIRRTAATRMGDLAIAPHIVEEILNHQSGHRRGVAGTYNRSRYEREVRSALGIWHDRIRTIVAGVPRVVLPFAAS